MLNIAVLNAAVLIVAFGAAAFIGGMLRGLLARWLPLFIGTLLANTLASFIAGIAIGFSLSLENPTTANIIQPVLAMGCAGALSTWSTLASELTSLVKSKRWRALGLYLGSTLILGLTCAHFGILCSLAISQAG